MLPPGTIFKLKKTGSLQWLHRSPGPLADFQAAPLWQGRRGQERGGNKRKEGVAFPCFFFYNLIIEYATKRRSDLNVVENGKDIIRSWCCTGCDAKLYRAQRQTSDDHSEVTTPGQNTGTDFGVRH